MKTRVVILVLGVAAVGIATNFLPRHHYTTLNEDWLVSHTASEVVGYKMLPGIDGKNVSYRMDKETYTKLKPIGIAARVFQGDKNKIDTVVIAGDSPDNFHDPTWCLPGQGWIIGPRLTKIVHSDDLGDVKLSYFEAKQADRSMLVAYTFHSPAGYDNSITRLTLNMWKKEFLSGKRPLGSFYRFLPTEGEMTIDQLSPFILNYLERTRLVSGGLL